jgi:hypothetical protein
MKSNSKRIGNNYERLFSYKLSEWITGEKGSDICWRDVGSGNRYTKRKQQNKETSRKADIVCTDLKYQKFFDLFYIDTKTYKDINLVFTNQSNIKSNEIFKQWIKTINDCPKNMIPFMPCKIRNNKTPEFIILPLGVFFNCDNVINYFVQYENIEYKFNLVLQDDFFKNNNWLNFLERNKKII